MTQDNNKNNNQHQNNGQTALPPIPSPYNFVPLSEKVLFPDWAKDVSMDIPFKDGISGRMELTVTAMTPIYIRNGGKHPEGAARDSDTDYQEFFQVVNKGQYAIPGTSFKGMLRNIIEIATFSKIAGSNDKSARVNNRRYAVRDLGYSKYRDKITDDTEHVYKPKVKAAWLYKEQGEWKIKLCEFARIEQEDLEKKLEIKLGEKTLKIDDKEIDNNSEQKYNQIIAKKSTTKIYIQNQTNPNEMVHKHSTKFPLYYSKVTAFSFENLTEYTEGELVFTGQPSTRKGQNPTNDKGEKISRGKHMEFVFYSVSANPITLPPEIRKNFEFVHSENGKNRKPNSEWKYWKIKMNAEEKVPVFVLPKDERKGILAPEDIDSIGLAMMFRLPYEFDIFHAISETNEEHLNSSRLDFAETLFGTVNNEDALRGRVNFETFIADKNDFKTNEMITTAMGGPKSTFYPNYIEQTDPEGPKTLMDNDARISGWKRYFVKTDGDKNENNCNRSSKKANESTNNEIKTFFKPLPKGVSFTGKMHFHNLKPFELGALIWALTWGGNSKLRHQVGMAKPFGFGSVTVKIGQKEMIPNKTLEKPLEQENYMKIFKEYMENKCEDKWEKSLQFKALLAMADTTKISNDNKRTDLNNMEMNYPEINMLHNRNEFDKIKNNKNRRYLAVYKDGERLNKLQLFKTWFNETGKNLQPGSHNQIIKKLQELIGDDLAAGKAMVKVGFGKAAMADTLKDFIKVDGNLNTNLTNM